MYVPQLFVAHVCVCAVVRPLYIAPIYCHEDPYILPRPLYIATRPLYIATSSLTYIYNMYVPQHVVARVFAMDYLLSLRKD